MITAPADGTIVTSASGLNVSWDFAGADTATEAVCQLRDEYGQTVIWESSPVATPGGTTPDFTVSHVMASGASYEVQVRYRRTSDGTLVTLTSVFRVETSTTPAFPTITSNGAWEVAINGEGFIVRDTPEAPYRRQLSTLQAPRLATGSTPFSEAIERYTFVGVNDWSGGAGQELASRPTSDTSRYLTSQNIDPFEEGKLRLSPHLEQLHALTGTDSWLIAYDGGYMSVENVGSTLRHRASVGASATSTLSFSPPVVDIATDGLQAFLLRTDGRVFVTTDGATGANQGAVSGALTANGAERIGWIGDRVAVGYTDSNDNACFSTLDAGMVEEVAGGRFKHPDGAIADITGGDGYAYYIVNRAEQSQVYAWQLGSTDASFIALTVPAGERAFHIGFYLGNVFLYTADGANHHVYRAIPSNGALTPQKVLSFPNTTTPTYRGNSFTGYGNLVLFPWPGMSDTGRSGAGAIDLETGGWARYLSVPAGAGVGGTVNDIITLGSTIIFGVGGEGIFATNQTATVFNDGDTYVTFSADDLGSGIRKVLDEITLVFTPESSTTVSTVTVDVDLHDGTGWRTVGDMTTGPSQLTGRFNVDLECRTFSVRVSFTQYDPGFGASPAIPELSLVQTKLHPLSEVDEVIQLPLDLSDRAVSPNGRPAPTTPEPFDRFRALRQLVGTRVTFQDVDHEPGLVETFELAACDFTTAGVSGRSGRREETNPTAVIQLRRSK